MVRAAVIGVGYLGNFHAEKYAQSKNAELVAIVDHNPDRHQSIAVKNRTVGFSDYHKLTDIGVDCVSIASDTSTHYEIAKWCLSNGIDVLVEKPMTVETGQAEELISLAQQNERILQVGHLERFNPAFAAVKKVLTNPLFFEARRIAKFAGRGHDVDVVLDLMIHDIDIICHLAAKPVATLEAVGTPVLTDSIDIANARITFQDGAIANVTASRAAFNTERTIRIFQPDLYVSLDYQKKKLKVYKKGVDKNLLGVPNIQVKEHQVEVRDALADEIESFIESVKTRKEPVVTGLDGLKALKLAEDIRKAVKASAQKAGLAPVASY